MLNDPLELFWLCAHTENPVLPYEQFRMIPEDVRSSLLDAGLLKEGQPSRTVECDGCDEGHVEEVMQMDYANGKRRFFISCPECTSVEVNPKRLKQWVPDYGKVAAFVSAGLDCFGGLTEIIPNRLWKLGQSPLGHKPISIWLARYIVDDIVTALAQVGDGILLVLGVNPRFGIDVAEERIININQIVAYDDNSIVVKQQNAKLILESLTDSNSSLPLYIFRRKGSMWQIRFDGQDDFYLPDRKGAEYLRQFLLSPDKAVDTFDIVAQSSAQTCANLMSVHEAIDSGLTLSDNALLASAGAISDWKAIEQYRSEVLRLLAEKEKAKRDNSTVELDQIEKDIAVIVQEINKSVNVHGKLNMAVDKRRNLRDAFSKSVKRFITEIEKTDTACAGHFTQAITYGNQPTYRPNAPINWETEFILS